MHRIENIELEIAGGATGLAGRLEDEIQFLGTPAFWEPLVEVFDACAGPDSVCLIETLSIDLHISADKDWKRVLQEQIKKEVEQFLLQHTKGRGIRPVVAGRGLSAASKGNEEDGVRLLSLAQRRVEEFLYYLVHGVAPWTADAETFAEEYFGQQLTEALQQYPSLWKDFIKRHRSLAEMIARRLSIHCPERLTSLLLEILVPQQASRLRAAGEVWIEQLQKTGLSQPAAVLRDHFRQQTLNVVWQTWPVLPEEKEMLIEIARRWLHAVISGEAQLSPAQIEQIQQTFLLPPQATREEQAALSVLHRAMKDIFTKDSPSYSPPAPEPSLSPAAADVLPSLADLSGYEVVHAGMILLYPYMRAFFTHLDLLDTRGRFLHEKARQQGVYWWHYLASGVGGWPEPVYALGKMLCGMELSDVLQHRPDWREEDVQEGHDLLEAFITHWKILGNCSVEALRETFLMRKGRLSLQDGGWRLVVETSGVDLLLDHLPFPLSQVYLPWLEKAIRVEWI